MASSEVLPTALSFLCKNLINFCRLSSGTTGRPSMTTNVSKPSSSFTSYCALRSEMGNAKSQQRGAWTSEIPHHTHPRSRPLRLPPREDHARTGYQNSAPWWMRRMGVSGGEKEREGNPYCSGLAAFVLFLEFRAKKQNQVGCAMR